MSTFKTKNIESALQNKGFVKNNSRHEHYLFYWHGKKTPVHTIISHAYSEYDDKLLSLMARQLKLNRAQLNDLIECPLDEEAYGALLQAGNHI